MAVVFMEGFDHVTEAQLFAAKGWTNISNVSAMVSGRFGGQAGSSANGYKSHALPAGYSTVIFGFGFQVTSLTTGDDLVFLMGSGTSVVRMRLATSGGVAVLQLINSSGTQLALGTTSIVASGWYHVQIKVVVSASVGSVEVRLNGAATAEASASSVNTGSTNIDTFRFGTNASQACRIDDLWVVDTTGSAPTNNFLGDCKIETLAPAAEGADTAWTANTGTKVSRVNDSTSYDGDTGYISSSTPGDRQTFTMNDLSTVTGTVFAVQTNLVARKDDAGTRTIAPVIRISSTDYDGTTSGALGTSYLDYMQLYERLDPAGAGWTISTVNAMETGVKVVA